MLPAALKKVPRLLLQPSDLSKAARPATGNRQSISYPWPTPTGSPHTCKSVPVHKRTDTLLWSANGLARLLGSIDQIRTYYNPTLTIGGIIINQHEARTTSGGHWISELTHEVEQRGLTIFNPPIPKRVAIADSVEASQPLEQWPTQEAAQLADIYTQYLHAIHNHQEEQGN